MRAPALYKAICLSALMTCGMCIVAQEAAQHNNKFLQVSQASQVLTKDPLHYVTVGQYSYSTDTANPFADFLFGVIFIFFSFPILWNNERK